MNRLAIVGYAGPVKRKRTEPIIVEARSSTSLGDVVLPAQKEGKQKQRRASSWGANPEGNCEWDPDRPRKKKPKAYRARESEPIQTGIVPYGQPNRADRKKRSEDEAGNPRKERKRPSALAMAVAMLARREHSQAELLQKLLLKEVPEDEAKAAIQRLADEGLQSDERFLESRVRIKLNAGHGPNRAQFELSRHGLNEDRVDQAVDGRDEKWQEAAYDLIERKYGPSPLPREVQNKAFSLLVRRGFTYDQAWAAIRQPRPQSDD